MIDRLLRFAVVIVAIAFLPLTAEAGNPSPSFAVPIEGQGPAMILIPDSGLRLVWCGVGRRGGTLQDTVYVPGPDTSRLRTPGSARRCCCLPVPRFQARSAAWQACSADRVTCCEKPVMMTSVATSVCFASSRVSRSWCSRSVSRWVGRRHSTGARGPRSISQRSSPHLPCNTPSGCRESCAGGLRLRCARTPWAHWRGGVANIARPSSAGPWG